MTNWKELLASNKEPIEVAGKALALAAAILYVCGYIAERVHWNLFGYVLSPVDHTELLYRGGNVVISSAASLMLFGLAPLAPGLFAWVFLATVAAGGVLLWRGRAAKSRWLVCAAAIALCGFFVYQCRLAPGPITPDTLLAGICAKSVRLETQFFESWAGMAGLAWILWRFAARTAALAPGREIRTAASGARVFFWGVLVALPFLYGAYRYPWMYPEAELSISGAAPVAGRCALVSELKDDYVLFCRGSESSVRRVRKDKVTSVVLRAPFDIRLR
ncbi:MAG: hypothetical protein HY822_21085 [Acidobacteria bacterium]|nr:hypothetical protein [Acidobacteriota bacterium]